MRPLRLARVSLIVVVTLAALALAADRVAVRLVQAEAEDRIRQEYDLSKSPEITIRGFPFLTQVLHRRFGRVDVNLSGVRAAGEGDSSLTLVEAKARLYDLKVSGGSWDHATAARATGDVRFSYADVGRAIPGNVVRVSYGGKDLAGQDQVKATVGVTFLGQRIENSATGTITVENGDTIHLRATNIEGADAVPGLSDYLRERIDYEWKIDDLPSGIELKDVQVNRDGIAISGKGTNVELSR
ncbi:hypothetical protein SRB5_32480 [Streptomyces sp. RB5]|uniref:DUF2993 domain-containing protein n=1 Tax=Streptomyces smaragdinus TaxID=2585196 RepID=A0A7K0CI09_9ACTN|nr:DUF2993 domain-containing protein [Streptomyces smaragdinus]MQY13107.1 hypothetical protein [Streptomyces smaragdinus]